MLNVNELTSRMAKMSDDQLRQYAQIHKNDPYTLALAASESKRRSQLRAGGQQQAAQQPTVADQAIAQMGAPAPMPQPQLPEQQGIGMLPAQNVEGMADGGIAGYGDSYADEYANGGVVAFDNGGGVFGPSLSDIFSNKAREDFDKGEYKTSPMGRFFSFLTPDAYTTDTRNQLTDIDKKYSALRNEYKNLTGAFGFRAQSPQEQVRASELEKQMAALEQQASTIRSRPDATVRAAHEKQVAAAQPAPAATDKSPTPAETYRNITAPNPPKPPSKSKSGGPYSDSPAGRNAAANRPGAGTTRDEKAGIASASNFAPNKPGSLTDQFNIMKGLMPSGAEYDKLATEAEAGFAKRAREREASRPKDKAYTGLEALLGKEEEKAKGKEARNLKMALIGAGLAIAGGKSQYALQNIAEGAQVGTKQYQEGVEKLEAAAVERRKQAAMIEEARRAEARGDWKEAEALNQQAFEAGLGIKRSKIDAISKITGDSLKAATDRVNTQEQIYSQDMRTIYTQGEETKRHEALMRNQRTVAGINAAAYAARADQRGQITPALMLKEYNDLLGSNPLAKKQYPTFESYMAAIQQASQGGKDPYAGWGNLQVASGK